MSQSWRRRFDGLEPSQLVGDDAGSRGADLAPQQQSVTTFYAEENAYMINIDGGVTVRTPTGRDG